MTMLLYSQIVLAVYFLSCSANELNISLSVFVSNSSVLQTVQSDRLIDEALQLGDTDGITITRNQEFDSSCDPRLAMTAVPSSSSSQMISVLMDGSCSVVAENVSLSSRDQFITMIFSSTSASINNSTVTMETFRTIPSDRTTPSSLYSLMEYFNWTQFSLVTSERESQFIELKRLINQELDSDAVDVTKINVVTSTDSTSVGDSIQLLFNEQPHLYFLNTDIQTGIQFLCEGIEESRYYPNYLWILPSWWYQVGVAKQWWDDPSLISGTRCSSVNDLRTVLDRALILRSVPANTSNNNEVLKFDTSDIDVVQYSTGSYAVDATLSLLLALNETGPQSSRNELISALKRVQFQGISGSVRFDSNGDRADVMTIVQQIVLANDTLSVVDVAYSMNGSNLNLLVSDIDAIFPDGVPPDGTPIKSLKTIELGITVFVLLLCLVGLIMAIVCLLFNIFFKDKKIVKLTSPNLNYFLIAGVITLLLGMIFYVIGTTDLEFLVFICLLRRLLVSIGHDIGFTVALLKTWRIHYIFKNPTPNKRAPKDWKLLMIAFSIVAIDAGISLILLILDAVYNKVDFVDDQEYRPITRENGVREQFCAPSCGTTPFYLVFLAFTMIFKITIHIIAIILSFRIRKIVVDTLNDFKYTSVIVYTSTILIIILVAVLISTVNYINVYGAVVPFLVFLEVLVFLIFSFVPKMIGLYKDPKGLRVMDKPNKDREASDIGGSLRRGVSLSYYNRKNSSIKDEGSDSGRCTLDSKDQNNIPKIPEVNEEKIEDNVFIESNGANGNLPANNVENKNGEKHRRQTDV